MDISFHNSRFFIGIDLGTTNIALSYVDRMSESPRKIHLFQIPQIIAPGEIHEISSLPSFYFIAPEHELSGGAMDMPWSNDSKHVVGYYARNHGASMPDRFISSAKSWLAHSGVDRTAPILPWGSAIKEAMLSPVEVSKTYICHLKNAWNNKFGALRDSDGSPCLMEDQMIVITIPASFDEVARELTVQAAREAGFER
jgi:molecular chaperone DnaK (HSP70)